MGTGRVCLLLAVLALLAAPVFAQNPPAKKPDPKKPAEKPAAKPAAPPAAKPKPPPKPEIVFGEDGSIETKNGIARYWQVNHRQPDKLAKELDKYKAFLGTGVTFAAADRKNTLRIEAPAEKWPLVEKLIEVLDVPEPQVYVEAKIIELKYDSNLEFGIEGSYDRSAGTDAAQPFFQSFTGAFNPESYLESLTAGLDWQGSTFNFKTVNDRWVVKNGAYEYVVRMLQERGSAEILSQPSIIARQDETAMIRTGVKFPIQAVDLRGNQTIVTTKFYDTGIVLEIKPSLVGRDFVSMSINAEDSQITDTVPGPGGTIVPVIAQRSAKTVVNVRDGETIIIGGLLSSTTRDERRGIPLIMDIPIVGYLFSSTKSEEVKSELVFFITPRIIRREEGTIIVPPGELERAGAAAMGLGGE